MRILFFSVEFLRYSKVFIFIRIFQYSCIYGEKSRRVRIRNKFEKKINLLAVSVTIYHHREIGKLITPVTK